MAKDKTSPLTVEEILDSLDPLARQEVNNPDFMEPLKLLLEGVNDDKMSQKNREMMLVKIK